MALWDRLLKRSTTTTPASPAEWFVNLIGGSASKAGARVTPDSAIGNTAVWRAVSLLSSSLASLPLQVYRRLPNGGKEPDRDHPLYRLLHEAPNERQTSVEWREMMGGHLELRGNAFSWIETDRKGQVKALWPLTPTRMQVLIAPDERLVYEYTPRSGARIHYREEEILHLRGLSSDGIIGLSPVAVAREALGISAAAEEHAASFYGNGTVVGGVLEHPARLTTEAFSRIEDSWKKRHGGSGNAWKPAILEEGMKWHQLGMSSKDAQFLETRKYQVEEVARIWGVPLHKLQSMDRSTFSNIEHQAIEFVVDAIRPRCVRMEQRMDLTLLLERERTTHFISFKIDGLLRGDLKTRYEAYAIARNWGWLCADDVRDLENMNPLPDGQGKVFLMPQNMQPAPDPAAAKTLAAPAAAPQPRRRAPSDDEDDDESRAQQVLRAYEPVLVDAFGRAARKELLALQRRAATGVAAADVVAWHETFWRDHERTLADQLMPAMSGLLRALGDDAPDDGLRAIAMATAAAVREHHAASASLQSALADGSLRTDELDRWRAERPARAFARERDHLLTTLLEGSLHEAAATS